jgi:hypothetical protein
VPHRHIIQYFPVQALYQEPCTRPYEIRIYLHSSVLRALTAGQFRAYKARNSCEEGLLYNLLGVRPVPTRYSLYALKSILART